MKVKLVSWGKKFVITAAVVLVPVAINALNELIPILIENDAPSV
jgi:hypothetical protein